MSSILFAGIGTNLVILGAETFGTFVVCVAFVNFMMGSIDYYKRGGGPWDE